MLNVLKKQTRESQKHKKACKNKKRSFKYFIKMMIVQSIVLSSVVFILYFVYKAFKVFSSNETFLIKDIEVQFENEAKYLSIAQIVNLASLKKFTNIFGENLVNVKENLLENKWVSAVTVDRQLPNKIIIKVKEKEPYVQAQIDDNLFYIDKDGKIITKVIRKEDNLPVIICEKDEICEDTELLKKTVFLIDELKKYNLVRKIKKIKINDDGMSFYNEEDNIIYFGRSDFDVQFFKLEKITKDLKRKNLRFAKIDLSYIDKAIVKISH
jgi:cell division protein FtsQ